MYFTSSDSLFATSLPCKVSNICHQFRIMKSQLYNPNPQVIYIFRHNCFASNSFTIAFPLYHVQIYSASFMCDLNSESIRSYSDPGLCNSMKGIIFAGALISFLIPCLRIALAARHCRLKLKENQGDRSEKKWDASVPLISAESI